MNYSMIRYILSNVLGVEGIFLLLPVIVSIVYGEKQGYVYAIVAVVAIVLGLLGRLRKPKSTVFYSKEGFAIVSLSWLLMSFVGSLPMYFTGEFPSYIDALFETISGFTTTGASILSDVEALSYTTLFWRSFTHWIGGMGVLVFIMAILPMSGGSSIHLMRAESPGPSVEKLVPKAKNTAMILYGIYIAFTLLEMIALLIAGLSVFESATLTFGTVGTGGFALLNSGIASYSTAVQVIITVFMIICSINFNVYYLLLMRKPKEALLNEEIRFYAIVVVVTTVVITFNIRDEFSSLASAFQTTIFQVATVSSSTGYSTVDFNTWSQLSRTIMVMLMFMGACAGSTGGGFKVSRVLIILKAIKNQILSMVHPRSMQKVHINGRVIKNSAVSGVLCYMAIYVFIIAISCLLISVDGFDLTTNFTSVVATVNNIGPGLNMVGPTGNYGAFSNFSKIVLMFDMLAGRLELLPVLILFAPGMWKLPSRKMESGRKKKLDKSKVGQE